MIKDSLERSAIICRRGGRVRLRQEFVLVAGLEEASPLTLLNVKRLASEQNHGR